MTQQQFLCPHCHLLMQTDYRTAGKVSACPRCGGHFECPELVPQHLPYIFLNGKGQFTVEVVGESNYQAELEHLCGGRRRESAEVAAQALLHLEDDNPHDAKAVRVEISGYTVGYLTRDYARRLRGWLRKHAIVTQMIQCPALITGGWYRGPLDQGHYGVTLDITLRNEL